MKSQLKTFAFILVALALVRLAVMAVVPVFDPSEGRYAVLCANMAESGDFLVPRFVHDGVYQSFDGKPPLLFQLGGLACSVLGRRELAVRLPPFLAAVGLLGILFFAVRRLRGASAARTAVVVCATSVAFYATAGICMTDLPLTFCVGGALLLESVFVQAPGFLKYFFVNDGSTDDTAETLAFLTRESPAIQALYLPHNVGKAEAVRAGVQKLLAESRADWIGFWDADLATPLAELAAFRDAFERHPDVQAVLGTRWLFDVELLRRIPPRVLRHAVVEQPLSVWHDVPGSKLGLADSIRVFAELARIARLPRPEPIPSNTTMTQEKP